MNPIPKSFIPSTKDTCTTRKKNWVLWNGTSRGFFSFTLITIITGTVVIGLIGFFLVAKIAPDIPEKTPELIEENKIQSVVEDTPVVSTPGVAQEENIEKKTEAVVAPKLPTPATEPILDIEATKLDTNIKAATELPSLSIPKEAAPCDTVEKPQFTADITDFSKIKIITAPSTKAITGPKGFSYISTSRNRVPVYAPTAMTLRSGIYMKDTADSPPYYVLFFTTQENCNYTITYTLIDDLVTPTAEQIESTPTVGENPAALARNSVLLQAGDLIGYTKGAREDGRWGFGMYHSEEKGALAIEQNYYDDLGYSVCWTDFYFPARKQHYRNLLEGPQLVCEF